MGDWPQWRGPTRNGISAETGWASQWGGNGPKRLWKAQAGEGYSSIAIQGGRVYTMGNFQNQDYVSCLDALTGKLIWHHKYPCGAGDYTGPRATPAISAGKVYTMSREGHAFCLNVQTGKPLWEKNLASEVGAQPPGWGFAGSPLVDGAVVFFSMGTNGLALNKDTGRVLWKSGSDMPGYSSPQLVTVGGRRVLALFVKSGLVGVDPQNGKVLWQYPWQTSYDVNAADPIFTGDKVFISSNYGKGGALLQVRGNQVTPVWQTRDMKNHFNSCVLVGNALYGNDENTLKCIDLATGAERWRMRGMGKGGLIAADGKLLVTTERGELVIIEATPAKFTELARGTVLDGECWTSPALANGLLYCRNHEGALACVDLRK